MVSLLARRRLAPLVALFLSSLAAGCFSEEATLPKASEEPPPAPRPIEFQRVEGSHELMLTMPYAASTFVAPLGVGRMANCVAFTAREPAQVANLTLRFSWDAGHDGARELQFGVDVANPQAEVGQTSLAERSGPSPQEIRLEARNWTKGDHVTVWAKPAPGTPVVDQSVRLEHVLYYEGAAPSIGPPSTCRVNYFSV